MHIMHQLKYSERRRFTVPLSLYKNYQQDPSLELQTYGLWFQGTNSSADRADGRVDLEVGSYLISMT